MEAGALIYENPLSCPGDIEGFLLEGRANLHFSQGCMEMENALDSGLGQRANYVLWCPETFPKDIRIQWQFRPLTDIGLCILFFSAAGRKGEDLFAPTLAKRTGEYSQYHSGDMNAFHVSYFRRKEPQERAFHTCNLRKSHGFHLVAQGADPLPGAEDAKEFYNLEVEKKGKRVQFSVNGLVVFTFEDDGRTYGSLLGEGKIGFRQLAPLKACYRNLKVYEL